MKKTFLTLFLAGIVFSSFSQVRFGAQVGANIATASLKEPDSPGYSYTKKSRTGFTAGFLADIPIVSGLHFRPELNYTQKGCTIKGVYIGGVFTDKYQFNYLDLPLNFTYNIEAGPGNVFVGLGPMIGLGFGGKVKTDDNGIKESWKIKFDGKNTSDDYYHFKAIDFNLSTIAGYQLNMGPFISLGYNLGFNDIDPFDGYEWKNRSFFVKLGYTLGGATKTKK
jgi:hypothetical protein